MLYSRELKELLFTLINEMEEMKEKFVVNPQKDFSRKRKQNFQDIIKFILAMDNDAVKRELMKYFNFSTCAPSDAAFNQQRAKIKPSAFEYLFHRFTSFINDEKNYLGYRLIACDGTSLYIARNPNDGETYYNPSTSMLGFNLLHLNALYDLTNRKYLDAVIQPGHKNDERLALRTMITRLNTDAPNKTIVLADRGYVGLNVFDTIIRKGMKYLIRSREPDSKGRIYGIKLPDSREFDITKTVYFTHSSSKKILNESEDKTVIYVRKKKRNQFMENDVMHPFTFRIVKIMLNDNTPEYLITNLTPKEFSLNQLKELYNMRWGIETSYKELKYAAGLINFHAKKRDYIEQEIWSRLILFNFSEAIAMRISVEKKIHQSTTKYPYQLNYTTVLYLCRLYLKCVPLIQSVQLESLIEMNILPVRKGRNAFRTKRPHIPASFCYRTS